MNCANCNIPLECNDTVYNPRNNEVYRKWKCPVCGKKTHSAEFEVECNDEFIKTWNRWHKASIKLRELGGED